MKTIQEMAREAGAIVIHGNPKDRALVGFDVIEAFAKLVEAPLRSDIEELLQENTLLRARNDRLEAQPAQPQQEPHGWYIDGYGAVLRSMEPKSVRPGEWLPFFTSSSTQRKPWVGLTDDERLEVAEIDGADEWFWKVCKAIEAKLKEKNT